MLRNDPQKYPFHRTTPYPGVIDENAGAGTPGQGYRRAPGHLDGAFIVLYPCDYPVARRGVLRTASASV